VDNQGQVVPMQFVQPPALISGWRARICFQADLPALGWRVYRVKSMSHETRRQGDTETPAQENANLSLSPDLLVSWSADDTSLENDQLRLAIDPATGYISSLLDKRVGVEAFSGAAARPLVIADTSDTWSHDVYQFHELVGCFMAQSVKLVEQGPVRATLRVESVYGDSRLIQLFTLHSGLAQIDVRVIVDWREQFKILKLCFPINLNLFRATYEIPFGHIERPTDGTEEPGQSWVDLSGVARGADIPYGVSLLNDGKYSFDVRGRELSMTVLRSPIYAHHDPTQPRPDEAYHFIDRGIQQFNYTILPHPGGWEQAGTVRRAVELNQPPIALVETYHTGALLQADSYLSVDQANIVVSAIKQAEDGDDLVIRCYEAHKIATRATIALPRWGRQIEATFGPCEIKTFRVPRDAALPVVETNLLEESL
jgi:alpha-mannosidase